MATKKEIKTKLNWGQEAFNQLKEAHSNPSFSGKTEKKKLKEFETQDAFMWIVFEFEDKFKLCIPLNEEEYNYYKELELNFWNGKK